MDSCMWSIIAFFMILIARTNAAVIDLQWVIATDDTRRPTSFDQSVITINDMFPGPLINATTNDIVKVNVFNNLVEPLLFTWNGIQQRLNSWQDGVSGTNCAIQPGTNRTYAFVAKDQIGTFSYFPSINYQKLAGGFGPIRVNNRIVINVPFPKPEAEFDLLIGDWYFKDYKVIRSSLGASRDVPDMMLINGQPPHGYNTSRFYEVFKVNKGKTYRFRVSNIGSTLSFNFRIQNHKMVIVETEGSYTNQITLDSLDVHVGQSYSVLVTADLDDSSDYYIVASPKLLNTSDDSLLVGKAVLSYSISGAPVSGPIPDGPDPWDIEFSVNQARSIRWNLTAGAARPNPQGTFNVSNVTLSATYILHGSKANIGPWFRHVVNNVSYATPATPLKLADYYVNGSGVYRLGDFPTHSVKDIAKFGVSVVGAIHKGWHELVFQNDLSVMDSWHLDGYGFYIVGFGKGEWTSGSRSTYNLYDPVVRSTVQVYPGWWTAVYVFLDNPGMWNLRSQHLKHWYLGQELYVRVHDDDPNPAKEYPPPENLLLCGMFGEIAPGGAPEPQPGG
ncbi:monocopper oxidase-like protein SKU5 [Rutidosis leptorrhynchoides]|uniref:monocopper oxidase-like protein SKU5 n=1 Tax=Rutidosis leptorrhynchoides TaxID=125765 RepID=UPI003A996CF4